MQSKENILPGSISAIVLERAYNIAIRGGFESLTIQNIASSLQLPESQVSEWLGTLNDIRNKVIDLCIERNVTPKLSKTKVSEDIAKPRRTRMEPDERRTQLLEIAFGEAELHGYLKITREDIARAAGVSAGLVTTRLGEMEDLRSLIMSEAINRVNLKIIAEGLLSGDPQALTVSQQIRQDAIMFVASFINRLPFLSAHDERGEKGVNTFPNE